MVWVISNTAPAAGRTERNSEMSKTVTRMVVALVLGVVGLAGCVPAYAAEDSSPVGGWVLASTGAPVDVSGTPACEDEGQEYGPCVWDASKAGNGAGESFLVEEDGSVSYLRRADGTAVAAPAKKHKKTKSDESTAPEAPAPTEPPEARAYPGWVWTGRTAPVTTPGLPSCVDVHGQETCVRQGYTLVVNRSACAQTIITDQGNQYVPGPAVAQALSDSCQAHKPDTRDHEDNAGLSGTRSTSVVHSPAASAVVDEPVVKATSPSRDVVVGSVDSGVRDNYDGEVVVVFGVLTLLGLAYGVWWQRRRDGRRVGRHGGR
nr:MAG TPA: hypothetical protein [Caudoviricetes sp.]